MNFEKLKNLMDRFVSDGYAPGNAIQVYLGRDKVFEYAAGVSDIKSGKRMTGAEHFNIYSCSKITTVVAALQLVERGLILLSDPLYDYIPEYREMYIKNERGELIRTRGDITVKQLFNMTAGFSYDLKSPGIERARELTGGKMDTATVIRCLASDPLLFEPGEVFNYSLCHDVLGGLVSIVTGKKFRDYVKENIFDSLGMADSAYHITPEIEKNLATQYRFVPDGEMGDIDLVEAQRCGRAKNGSFVEVAPTVVYSFGEEYDSGGAGIITTLSDYAKLAAALANFGLGLTGERILSRGGVELLRTDTLTEAQRVGFNWRQLVGYGYGLGVRTLIDKAAAGSIGNLGEFGWGGAAGASVYVDPDRRLSAFYVKHTLNPREEYCQPRIRNTFYSCLD